MLKWGRKKDARKDAASEPSSSTADQEQRKRKLRDRFTDKNKWYWKFAQQRLPGWAPIITANWVVLYFFGVTVFCVAIGVPLLTASLSVKEYSVRYDNVGDFAGISRDQQRERLYRENGEGVNLTVSLTVQQRMKAPVYVFYELESYYQNHKRYVRSRSDNQLGGKGGAKGDASSSCSPEQYITNDGKPDGNLTNQGQINPCGLIAWSFFNDSYSVSAGNTPIDVDQSGIAWSYDRDHLYGSTPPLYFNTDAAKRGGNTSDVPVNRNEHLMVWLRPAVQPSFRKNWGRIDTTLEAGTVLSINVLNRYDTYRWGGAKRFVVSTNSWVGGKNLFLGIIYLVVAGLALIACLAFLLCYHAGLVRHRKFGDLSELSWQRRR